MSVPSQGEAFSLLLHHLAESQNQAAMLAHLTRAMSSSPKDRALADGWISVSELLKRLQYQVTAIAKGKLQ